MAIEDQGRNLQYRRARIKGPGDHFQALLAKAVRSLVSPTNRMEGLDQSGTDQRMINYVASQQGMLCGNMLVFSKGAQQLLLRAKEVHNAGDEAASYPLEALLAPIEDGTNAEFLESILYFCVRHNNVLVMQSRGLRGGAFEQHCNWLLRKAECLKDEDDMYLADYPNQTATKAIKNSHVKAVSIGMNFLEGVSEPSPDKGGRSKGSTISDQAKVKVKGPILTALKSLLGSGMDDLKLEDALNGNIEATISLKWSRKTTDDAQDVLDNIAVAMRNVDSEDVSIRLVDGTRVKGNDLKLSIPVTIKVKDGLALQNSIFKAMRESMNRLIEEKMIPL